MTTEALKALREKVAEGRVIDQTTSNFRADIDLLWQCFPTKTPPVSDTAGHARRAWGGSLDKAKNLHEKVLPTWQFWVGHLHGAADGFVAVVSEDTYPDAKSFRAFAENPARAWLLAILDALIAEAGNDRG